VNQPAATPLSRQDAMRQLLAGIEADLQSYQQMLDLIARQFEAAIRHQSENLAAIAQEMGALVDVLEARRAQRVELATRLTGPQATMEQVFALLKPDARARLEADWAQLEGMVQTAREMGRRNADLLAEQYTIMQRVLHGDDQTYEPV
jgi:flagella synthesis protein FlgN